MVVGPDVVEVLVEDHRRIERLLAEARERDDERGLSAGIAELARHVAVEEEYIYPLVSEVVPHGDRMAADALACDAEAQWLMKRLEGPAGVQLARLEARLAAVLRRHVRVTERQIFPQLRRSCAPDRLDHLAGVVEMARRSAPTHAHPHGPRRPPWNQILSPVIGLADRFRDAVTRRANRPEDV